MSQQVVKLDLDPCVAIFGSARLDETHEHYKAAYKLAKRLSNGFINVATGGGPGIMEAANKGAFEGKALSIGFKIKLPFEDKRSTEDYHHITLRQDAFHFRQTALIENANGYVAFLGGAGTEFEIYNVITLMQCGFIPKSQIQLYDKSVWKSFNIRLRNMVKRGTICEEDLQLCNITDDLEEIYENLKRIVRK